MAGIYETYDFMDLPLVTDDVRQRSTPTLPARAPTTYLIRFNLQDIIDESEATSPSVRSEQNANPPLAAEVNPSNQKKPV